MPSPRHIAESAGVFLTQARERVQAMREEFRARGKAARVSACDDLIQELDTFRLKVEEVGRGKKRSHG